MSGVPFSSRSGTVQVLVAVALVLFSLVFLRFVTLTFADESPRPAPEVTVIDIVMAADPEIREAEREMDRALRQLEEIERRRRGAFCGTDPIFNRYQEAQVALERARIHLLNLKHQRQHELTVQQELKLRAMQNPEVDEQLIHRLAFDPEMKHIPIMR